MMPSNQENGDSSRDLEQDGEARETIPQHEGAHLFSFDYYSWILQSAILRSIWDQLASETESTPSENDNPMHGPEVHDSPVSPPPLSSSDGFTTEASSSPSSSSSSSQSADTSSAIPLAPLPVDEDQDNNNYIRRRQSKQQSPLAAASSHSEASRRDHKPLVPLWTRWTEDGLHKWIRNGVVSLGVISARNPWTTIMAVVLVSFGVVATGILTNFTIVYDHETIFTPLQSLPAVHGQWVKEESGFVQSSELTMIIHAHGNNVLHIPTILKAFQALETVQNTVGYQELCAQSDFIDSETKEPICWIWSVTEFWDHNRTLFEESFLTSNATNDDEALIQAVSQATTQDGFPIFHEFILGAFEKAAANYSHLFPSGFDDNQESIEHNDETDNDGNKRSSWFHNLPHDSHDDEELYNSHENGTRPPPQAQLDYWIRHVPALVVTVGLPPASNVYTFQEHALSNLHALQHKWMQQEGTHDNPLSLRLEFFSSYAYELEYERALLQDFPLIPAVFFVMLGFTMFVFHNYGKATTSQGGCRTSRASLGIASTVTIGMSLMSSFGMAFCWGIPFTNITQMVPFIILGVGLDDTFIITGSYFRLLRGSHDKGEGGDPTTMKKGPSNATRSSFQNPIVSRESTVGQPTKQELDEQVVQRIHDSLQEVGLSISLTTLTTTFAFLLGAISTIPGIRWLCIYASLAIVFDFLYQVTFFLALLVLDERRVAGTLFTNGDGKVFGWWSSLCKFCCCCCCLCGCRSRDSGTQPGDSSSLSQPESSADFVSSAMEEDEAAQDFFMDRLMRWYAKQLLRPAVKVIVIVLFLAVLGLNIYSTTLLEQQFNIEDYVSKDSYTRSFLGALEEYTSIRVPMAIYFRGVDQSDPEIQRQMREFIDEISDMPQVGGPPQTCWVRDMYDILTAVELNKEQIVSESSALPAHMHDSHDDKLAFLSESLMNANITFEDRLNVMLNMPVIRDVYGEDIVLDDEGRITASRCYVFIRHIDLNQISEQINMLYDQREITLEQPINQLPEHKDDLAFFAYDTLFAYWQLYTVAVNELAFTTFWGVLSVCIIGFLIIPHWSAVLFVGPLIVILYFNLLGTMQLCGIYINAVTYVTVVISIGLLVDFLMHILLRYYEAKGSTRDEKVKETLETMGASMMLGGFTTWLGVIPLAFSSTKIFMTLFIAFFAMVSWGLLVGLVVLPVLLSICGPVVTTPTAAPVSAQASKSSKRPILRERYRYCMSPRSNQTQDETESSHLYYHTNSPMASTPLSSLHSQSPRSLSSLPEIPRILDEGGLSDDESFVTCPALDVA